MGNKQAVLVWLVHLTTSHDGKNMCVGILYFENLISSDCRLPLT